MQCSTPRLETGAKIKTQQWDGKGSLVTFVLKKNLHRRDISSSQRAVVALNAEKEYAEEAKERQQQSPGRPKKGTQFSEEVFEDNEKPDHPPTTHTTSSKSREQAAKLAGTNRDYASKIKKLEPC